MLFLFLITVIYYCDSLSLRGVALLEVRSQILAYDKLEIGFDTFSN